LVGGVVVGIAYHAMSPLDALNTFALLSIGNALVTTLPAFLNAIAMGMMVTRVASQGALGADLAEQLFARPEILRSAGALLLALALVPALPHVLFAILGGLAFGVAELARRRGIAREEAHDAAIAQSKRRAMRRPELALGLVGVDAVAIEIGGNLAPLLAPPLCDLLLDRIGEVRRALAAEIGIVLPGVRLRDDLERDPDTYAIRVRDELVAEGRLALERVLAVADPPILARLGGEPAREPVYDLPAVWIEPQARERAQEAGALVFDPISILGSHVAEAARAHADVLVGRQELQTLLEHLRSSVPTLVKEVGTDSLPLATIHRAFGLLLRERVWPRDPIAVLESMIESGSRDPRDLCEAARRALVPSMLKRRGLAGLEPLVLDPEFERELAGTWAAPGAAPDPADAIAVRDAVESYLEDPPASPALVCTAAMRPLLAEFLTRSGLPLEVLAYHELPSDLALRPVAMVGQERP
jgi:flagellar biosynthesis protein FlhA